MSPLHIGSQVPEVMPGAVQRSAVTDFEVGQLVQEAIELVSPPLPKDVALTFRRRGAGCWIRADSGQFRRVVVDLILNARDAIPGGGRIVIDSSSVMVSDVEVGLHGGVPAGEFALLKIADTGKGISPEHVRRILDPLFTTNPTGDSGLGLGMVCGAVTQCGGHIRIKSSQQAGSTFCLYLPLISHPTDEEQKIEPCARQGCPLAGTILVVDAEDAVRNSVRALLEEFGLAVEEASNATEALLKADTSAERLAVLVTNVVMPGMSGTQLAHILRQKHQELPLVFMSAYAVGEQGHELFERATFLQKPFSLATLIHALQRAGSCPNATGSRACATGQ